MIKTGGLEVTSTKFLLFKSSAGEQSGQSITYSMSTPLKTQTKFTDVTINWVNNIFDTSTYKGYLNSSGTTLTMSSPISLYPGLIDIKSSSFSNWINALHGGIIYSNLNSKISIDSSQFNQNWANDGGVIYISNTILSITNSQFSNNYAVKGGAIFGDSKSVIPIYDSNVWKYNYVSNEGGCLYIIGGSQIIITKSDFFNNQADLTSSALFFLGTGNNTITNANFYLNNAGSNTVSFMFANTDISNVNVYNNVVYDQSAGFFIAFSTVTIKNSKFYFTQYPNKYISNSQSAYNIPLNGWFISISSGSKVKVESSSFENGYGANGGAIYLSGSSDLIVNTCTFNNGYVIKRGGSIYAFGFNSVSITNCSFVNSFSEGDCSDIFLDSGTTDIQNSSFSIYPGPTSIYISSGNFTATSLVFNNSHPEFNAIFSSTNGAAIFSENMENFTILSSNFINLNFATAGGAIYLAINTKTRKTGLTNPIFIISSWTFKNNTSKNGGAIYFDYVEYASVTSSIFLLNSAKDNTSENGYGGAIFYGSSGRSIVFNI